MSSSSTVPFSLPAVPLSSTEEPQNNRGGTSSHGNETPLSLVYTSATDTPQQQRRDFQEQPYQLEDDLTHVLSQTHFHRHQHQHPSSRSPSPDPLRSSLNKELVVSQQHSHPSYHNTTAAAVLTTSTATIAIVDSRSPSFSAATASCRPSSRSSSSSAPHHHYTTFSPNLGVAGAEILSTVNLEDFSPSTIATATFENFDHPTAVTIIKVTACEESGWWFGQCEGRQGWFPSNHVERVPDGFEAEYSSRPTSITSEEYAEISTGIDGVELQYFGGKLSDNGPVLMGGSWTSTRVSQQPLSPRRRGGKRLAFPSRLSFIAQSSSNPSSPVEMLSVHPHDQVPVSSAETSSVSVESKSGAATNVQDQGLFTLDDFVGEINFHLRNLEQAIERKETSRYLPLICNMMWCVRTLFMSADVYDRDSATLAKYPEIGKSRRTILLAFGKIYPQCWIANGDRTGYGPKERQMAADKMGQLGQQIARGIKNFTIRAKKCGLQVSLPGHALRMNDMDFTAFDAKDAMAALGISAKEYCDSTDPGLTSLAAVSLNNGSTHSLSSNSGGQSSAIRTRRRVSRANSVKGFKSFNAIRQLRAEHASRYVAAKVSIEHLIAELMECLNDGERVQDLDNIIQRSIQASQMVTIFLASMDEMKAKNVSSNNTDQNSGNGNNSKDASKQRAELSRTLKELASFIESLDRRLADTLQEERFTTENILNHLMTLTSNILRCLLDMDVPRRSSFISQDCNPASDFYAGIPSAGSRGPGDNGGRLSVSQSRLHQNNGSASSTGTAKAASTGSKSTASASAHSRPPTSPACNIMSSGGGKLSSSAITHDLTGDHSTEIESNMGSIAFNGNGKDSLMLDPRITYGEAYGPEGHSAEPYRSTHDSAVVMLSSESTPHQSLLTGPRKAVQATILEQPSSPLEIEDVIEWTADFPQSCSEGRIDELKVLPEQIVKNATPVIEEQPRPSLEIKEIKVAHSVVEVSTGTQSYSEVSEEAPSKGFASNKEAATKSSPASQSSATLTSVTPHHTAVSPLSVVESTPSPITDSTSKADMAEIPPPSMRNQRPRRSATSTPVPVDSPTTSPRTGPQTTRRRPPRMTPTEMEPELTRSRSPSSPKQPTASTPTSPSNGNKANNTPKIPGSTAITYTSIVPVKAETFTIVQEPELPQEYLNATGLGIQMPAGPSSPTMGTRLPRRPTSPAVERTGVTRSNGISRAKSPTLTSPNVGRDTVSSRNRRADSSVAQPALGGATPAANTQSTRMSGSGSMIKLFGSSNLQAPTSSRRRSSLVASRASSDQQRISGGASDDHPPPPPPKRTSRQNSAEPADKENTTPGTRTSALKRSTPTPRSPSPSFVAQTSSRDSQQSKLKQHSTRRDSIQSIQSNLTASSLDFTTSRGDPTLSAQRATLTRSPRASPVTSSSQYAPSIQSNKSHRLSNDSHHHQHMPPSTSTSSSRIWRDPHHFQQQQQQQQQSQLAPGVMHRGRTSEDVPSARHNGLPWFLDHDHAPEEVLFSDEKVLQAATLEAMIEILTSHRGSPDPSFVTTFFATFRLFTTPVELTSMLVARFQKSPPAGLSEAELNVWKKQKLEIIQRRVHIALKTWLDGYWFSPKDRDAFKPIMEFVTTDMMAALPTQAGRMQEMLNQWSTRRQSLNVSAPQRPGSLTKAQSCDRVHQLANGTLSSLSSISSSSNSNSITSGSATVRETSFDYRSLKGTRKSIRRGIGLGGRDSIYTKGPPAPQMTKSLLNALMKEETMRLVPVTDIKPVELARQLTLYVNKLFLAIPYLELLDEERPNCPKMIQTANKITAWVTDTIVDEQDVKKRISVLKYWIEVCEECVKLNNFDSLTAIVCAIESTPVKRLDITWEGVNKGYRDRLVQLRTMISNESNYKVYRAKLKEVQAPCIPFLGLYFTTVTMIKDGNSMYKDPNVKSILPASRQSHTSSRVSASSAVSMSSQSTAVASSTNVSPLSSSTLPSTSPAPSLPKPKLLRYARFSRLATTVLEFRNFQGQYEYLEVQPLLNYIEHKLNSTDPQDSERNYRKSYAIEPRYQHHPPGAPPGTALPPPNHYRPIPTSYLQQSASPPSALAGSSASSTSSSQSNRAHLHQSMPSQPSSSVQHSRTSSQSSNNPSNGGMATAGFNPHHSHPVPPPPKVPTTKPNKFSRLWRSGQEDDDIVHLE
ncbi:hypothetical protein BGW41_001016 [Actinomortierella wolfii]|nr:hypothetical protein BGW41_001016 [Actinomortierella wolfii]